MALICTPERTCHQATDEISEEMVSLMGFHYISQEITMLPEDGVSQVCISHSYTGQSVALWGYS